MRRLHFQVYSLRGNTFNGRPSRSRSNRRIPRWQSSPLGDGADPGSRPERLGRCWRAGPRSQGTPVRTALQALAGEGLLDYAPNRGFTVREFPLDAIVDAYEIRASLEGVAARFAAERGLSADASSIIERSLAAGDKLLERGSFEGGGPTVFFAH